MAIDGKYGRVTLEHGSIGEDGLTVGRWVFEPFRTGGVMRHRVGMAGPSYGWTDCGHLATWMTPTAPASRVIVCASCLPPLDLVVRRHVPYFGAAGCRWCGERAALELIADGETVGYVCNQHVDRHDV